MLSKEMYDLLKRIPRYPETILASRLYEGNPMAARIKDLLLEAAHSDYEYINQSASRVLQSNFSLTEKGQALIEEYETAERNQKIVEESLQIAQKSLRVAQVAKWVAVFSAIAAFLSVLSQLPVLNQMIKSLLAPVQ